MKKTNKYLSFFLIALAVLGYTACEQELKVEEFETGLVDFSYQATSIHYVIGEEIAFINESKVGNSWEWNFGDGSTSSERDPMHKYEEPGTYTVKLIVDGGAYEIEKKIMVSDIIPIVSFSTSDPSVIFKQSEVTFDVQLLNPEGLPVTYNWSFPEGSTGEGIDENGKSELASPKVVFGAIGSQIVNLTIQLGEKELAPISVNVKVNYDKPAKTLYYAVKDGNLMARKLIYDDIDQNINQPFDLGYRSGKHPLTVQVAGDWVYVFDAGSRITYVADPTGLGDGEIFAVATDGSKRESVIENFGGDTYYDFYYGYIDEEANTLYWTDRREGIFRTSLNTRNAKFSLDEFNYFVQNNWLGYYGKGIYWGNVNGPILRRGDTWWWGKNSNGAGVFRFTESDIKGAPVEAEEPEPAAGSILTTFTIRGMVIDEVNQRLYVASQSHKVLFCFDMEGNFIKIVEAFGADDAPPTSNENVFISGMAIDVDENGDGYLYYAYRGPEGSEDPALQSGIKRYKLNDDAAEPEFYIEGVEAYGLAIDQVAK